MSQNLLALMPIILQIDGFLGKINTAIYGKRVKLANQK